MTCLARGVLGTDVAIMHSNDHGPFYDMVDTYGQHGTDNLSLWLTNAKEAAAKITEATRAKQKDKEEKYGKFLRDLHSRVAVSSRERNLSKIPQARPHHHPQGQIDSDVNVERCKFDGVGAHDEGRNLGPKDLLKPVPKMDKIRLYLEKELQKNSAGGHGISKLHRDCMMQALFRDKANETLAEKAYNIHQNLREDKSSVAKKTDCILPRLLTKPCVVPLPPTNILQMPDAVNSEPCTPKGWNLIPTSFSALEMRSLESTASPTPPDTSETGNVNLKPPPVLLPKENSKHRHVESHGVRVPGRSQSSLSRFCKGGQIEMRGKENVRSNTSIGNWILSNSSTHLHTKEKLGNILSGESKHKQSHLKASLSSPSVSNEGVTTCPMGVVVLKGREEYEMRGQGKQFFSDVWKCAMEVERRCAHERAHSLHVHKKKRLEQQKAEKRHKAELMREKSIARQHEAVRKQLRSVADLKARREGIVQRHRAVEKKRFLKKSWYEEKPTILDHVEECEIGGCDTDLTSTQRLLSLDNSKTWLKLQALHKQLYLNHLAEKKWMRFLHALQAVRMEKMQEEYGVAVPPICNCGHGVHPLNVRYIKQCHVDCPLRNNFPEYALRLENKLQQLLDDFNASSYFEDDLLWHSRQYF